MNQYEIERKYRIKSLPDSIRISNKLDIEQYYVSINPEIRIRKSGSDFYITIKGEGNLIRSEYEFSIDKEQFETNKSKIINTTTVLQKTRYRVSYTNNHIIEIDVYHGFLEGLIIAEVEFDSIDESNSFIPPNWFEMEVTNDPRFKNKNLARVKSMLELDTNL